MAPVEHGAHGAMPIRGGIAGGGEQREPVLQRIGDLVDREHPHPRRGELEGERQAVETSADAGDRQRVRVVDGETGTDDLRPGREQLRRFRVPQFLRRRDTHGRSGQRWDLPDRLAVDAQYLAAGDHHVQLRALAQQVGDDLGAGGEEVLAVVEHHEMAPVAKVGADGVEQGAPRRVGHVERVDQGARYPRGVGERGQVDPAHRVGLAAIPVVRDLHGEPGLAAAAGTDQADRARGGERRADGVEFAAPTDVRAQRDRQPARPLRRVRFGRHRQSAHRSVLCAPNPDIRRAQAITSMEVLKVISTRTHRRTRRRRATRWLRAARRRYMGVVRRRHRAADRDRPALGECSWPEFLRCAHR